MSTEAKCTCPSGDGSLRWPCPAHPSHMGQLHQHLLDMLGAKDHVDAGRIIGDLHAAALNEQSGNSGQLRGDAASGGDAPIDVTDPWRGLYQPERLRAYNEYGEVCHPDTPSWPDDSEDAVDKLVHAQGFDFQIVAGDFSDEATEDGDELYWQEMRAWNPEAPEGDWRLAWKGYTEDGPYAWFVRPMALRPAPEALTAGEPVGKEPAMYADTEFRQAQSAEYMAMGKGSKEGLWPRINAKYIVPLYTAPPAPAPVGQDRMAIKLLVAAGFVTEEKANESLRIAHGFGGDLGQPAPAAVPVDTFQDGVSRWMGECFLPSLYSNMTERGDRLLEEVLELLQSKGYDPARVQTLVQYVYGRPVGDPAQEVGGVMVTLAGYCWIAGLNMHDEGARELARITQPEVMAKIRRKQEAKNALHFDTPLPGHATPPQPAAANADINATRYLYLRSQPVEGGPWGTPRIAIPSSERAGQFANGEDADAAIDAAIAALNASLDKPAAAKDGDA